jgi:hypothetical protein
VRIAASVLAGALALAIAGPARARDPVAEGRYHLRKANALAGDDRCESAIKEFTLAFEKLHDPVVLFNRAECYRRIGAAASAAADYRAFLHAAPGARNRAEIEAKIAALEPGPVAGRASQAAQAAPSPRARRAAPAPAPMLGPPEAPLPPASPGAGTETSPGAATETPLSASLAASEISDARSASSAPNRRSDVWRWAALGVAVAGGAVGAYFVLRTPGATAPGTELGNYRF